jgi:hypothetical protein
MIETGERVRDVSVTVYPDDRALREQVMRPYRPNCRYLGSAELHASAGRVRLRGTFGIDESCYIDDTGHFNAVEFNICFNQATYYLVASCVREKLFDAFAGWTMTDFWQRQLPNVLIYRYCSRFRRPIDRSSFDGEVTFGEPVISARAGKEPVMFIDGSCRFWDANGGEADGQITLAVTNLPGQVGP